MKRQVNKKMAIMMVLMMCLLIPTFYKAQSLEFSQEELNEIHHQEETEINPYHKEFDIEDKEEAMEYYKKLEDYIDSLIEGSESKKQTRSGITVQDDVGNKYKYTNGDYNPYNGDYGLYFGDPMYFEFEGKIHVTTSQFYTVRDPKGRAPMDTSIFCIQANEEFFSVDDIKPGNSHYQNLTDKEKEQVDILVSVITGLFANTGNMDYLSAGQMKIWETLGADNITLPNSIKAEYEEIESELNTFYKEPSFINDDISTYTLIYNEENKRYETHLKDTNKVLDDRYIDNLIGTYGIYHVEDGKSDNDLYIWVSQEDGYGADKSSVIKSIYNPLPTSGDRLGIHYVDEPLYVNSGQDTIAGRSRSNEIKLQFEVKEAKGSVSFVKYGREDEAINGANEDYPLQGVTFGLYKEDGTKVDEVKSLENGLVEFNDIQLGKYYVQEIKTKEGYVLNEEKYYFEITKDNENINLNSGTIVNEKIVGQAILLKQGENKSPANNNIIGLEDVAFTVYDSSGNTVEVIYSDENGVVKTSKLIYGKYKICETSAIDGYLNSGYCEEFEVKENNQIVELNGGNPLINELIKGRVILNKSGENFDNDDSNKYPIKDTEFTIYLDVNVNGIVDAEDKVVEVLTTDENGYLQSNYLKGGNQYIIVETKAEAGYVNGGFSEVFKIDKQNQIIAINSGQDIENKVIKGQVEVFKGGSDKNESNEHEYFIYYPIYLDSNANGIVDRQESKPIDLSTKDEITRKYSDAKYIVDYENPNRSNLYPLKGIEFTIYKDLNSNKKLDKDEEVKGNIEEVLVTDENGHAISKDLKYADYILKETKGIEGYENLGYYQAFSITEDGVVLSLFNDKPLENKKIYGSLELIKIDSKTEERLSGAKFSIYKDLNGNGKLDKEEEVDDNIVNSKVTNENGYIKFEYIEQGKYIFKEVRAPENYKLDEDLEKAFEIKENNQTYKFKVKNTKIEEVSYLITGKGIKKIKVIAFVMISIIVIVGILKIKRTNV